MKIAKDLKVTAKNLNSNDIVIDENLDTQNFEEQTEMSANGTNETLYEVDLDEIAALLERELDEQEHPDDELGELDIIVGADDLDALGLDPDAIEDLDLSALDVDVSLADDLVGEEGEEEVELDLDLDEIDEPPQPKPPKEKKLEYKLSFNNETELDQWYEFLSELKLSTDDEEFPTTSQKIINYINKHPIQI